MQAKPPFMVHHTGKKSESAKLDFIVRGLSSKPFRHLYGLSDEHLRAKGVKRLVCDESPGFPDRIEMRDAEVGEAMLLLNHISMNKNSPYRSTHAIFVREGAHKTFEAKNEIPPVMFNRLLSLRAFDEDGMIVDAEIAQGDDIAPAIVKLLASPNLAHIDAHNAARGCFSGRIFKI